MKPLKAFQIIASACSIIGFAITMLPFFGVRFILVTVPVFEISGEATAVGVPVSNIALPVAIMFLVVAYYASKKK